MATVFEKLLFKDLPEIVVLNAPGSFEPALATLHGVTIHREVPVTGVGFALAFVMRQAELDAVAQALTMRATGDAALWFAYPKKSSPRLQCEFDRDHGWQVLSDAGYDTVRMIAIDEDWSALRWRKAHYIRNSTRDTARATTTEPRQRTRPG